MSQLKPKKTLETDVRQPLRERSVFRGVFSFEKLYTRVFVVNFITFHNFRLDENDVRVTK